MVEVTEEFNKIESAIQVIQQLFEDMQLTPAEGLAALDVIKHKTLEGMIKGINFKNVSGHPMEIRVKRRP